MGTEVQQAKSFEERMIDKMRENIGDLITPEEMKKIVDVGLYRIFNHREPIRNSWGNLQGEQPSLAEKISKELLQPAVEKQIRAWMADNGDTLEALIAKTVKEGMGAAIVNAINTRFSSELFAFGETILQRARTGA